MVDATSFAQRSEPQRDLRARELTQLTEWLQADAGSVVLLAGPRGVGKDRLAEDLARFAGSLPQTAIFEGRTPAAGGRSFHPYAEIVHQALAWAEQAGLAAQLIDPLYPSLAPVLEHAAAEDLSSTSLDQKLSFFDATRRLLAGIGRRGRVLVLVHDLERADLDTLELSRFLSDELFGDPSLDPEAAPAGMLLLSVRDDARTAQSARDFLAELTDRPAVRTMRLEGLDLEGLRSYVQSPHVLEKLLAASEGLPRELDALIEGLPNNVEELFERKLAGLEPTSREALCALAISGRPASARTLATVTGLPLKQLASALNELRDARIVERRIQNGEFQFSFGHRRDLEVTERSTDLEVRARLHGGWAAALAREPDPSAPALLAHHQLRSAHPEDGVSTAVLAAETYAVAGALNAAMEMLECARPHAEGEARLSIAHRLAELAPLTGSPRRGLRYVEELKKALPADQQGIAFLREAELHNAAGDYDDALAALEAARRSVPESALLERARIEATASEACYHLSARVEAAKAASEGLELLAAMNGQAPARVRIELLNQLGKIALADDDAPKAIEFFRETLEDAERSGLGSEQARSLINIGMAQVRLGQPNKAEQSLLAGIEKARAVNDLARLAFGHLNLGVFAHQCGDLGRAVECYRECRSLFRRLGNRTQLARVLHNLASLHLLCGDPSRARVYNDEALRLAKRSGVERVVAIATVVEGVILGELAEPEAGEAKLREGMLLLRKIGTERPLEALVELVEFQLRARALDRASETLEELERALESYASPVLRARADYSRGLLLLERGETGAEAPLARAREAFVQMGRQLQVRDVEVALARALITSGRRETARMHLAAAQQLQDAIGRELPEDLRRTFERGRLQQAVAEVRLELEGRATSRLLGPAPSPQRRREPTAIQPERKPEWRQRYGAIVGASSKLFRVFHILDRVAPSDGTVLIYGESGTGKELIAEAIHNQSPRARGPFVKLNCAALVESLLLSELFGHERGSFTGAHQRKIGRFEMAAGGTLFLDEIGDISPKTQVALLRVLQEREFERVGGGRAIKVEARIIFATNKNLAQMVREGTFREDLYYRLKGITIDLPPLRDRPEDVVALAEHFLGQFAGEAGTAPKSLAADAVELLTSYGWPGNIRELENIIRSVALFAEGEVISGRDFDEYRELFGGTSDLAESRPSSPAAPATFAPPVAELPRPAHLSVSSAPALPSRLPAPPPRSEPRSESDRHEPSLPAPAEVHRAPAGEPAHTSSESGDEQVLSQIFQRGVPLPELKRRIQAEAIARALRMTEGNITKAAEVLGMRRPRLSQIINADEELKALCQGASR